MPGLSERHRDLIQELKRAGMMETPHMEILSERDQKAVEQQEVSPADVRSIRMREHELETLLCAAEDRARG